MNGIVQRFAKLCSGAMTGRVLEVGSLNVNGDVRDIINIAVGVDMREGKGVDQVVNSSDLLAVFGPDSFDSVCSFDTLEHIEDWRAAMVNMWGVLKPDGYLCLSIASPRKGYHGYPHDYWRWDFNRFLLLFGENKISKTFDEGTSHGVLVKKTHPLNLEIKPDPVCR